jgi:predicted dehydrogenase
MQKVRVGIIGAGWAGSTHSEALRYAPSAELIAIADPKFANGDHPNLAEQYGAQALTEAEALIIREDIDAIFIASPHHLHESQAVAAARAGKHVFVEKPMATSEEDCHEMIEACAQAGVRLMVGHFQRFREPAQAVNLVLESGVLGRILMVREMMVEPSEGAWRDLPESKGVLLGYGIHSIDRIRWWLGSEVEKVCALSDSFRDLPVEDGSQVLMRFSNGTQVSLMCTSVWPVHDPMSPGAVPAKVMLLGEKGVLDVNMYGNVHMATGGPWRTITTLPKWESPRAFQRIRAYALQARDFIAAILENREPSISGKDGLAAVRIALGAYESSKDNRWVRL